MSISTDPIIMNTVFQKLWTIQQIFINNKQVTNKMVNNSCFNLCFLILCEPPMYPRPGFIPKYYSKTEKKNYSYVTNWLRNTKSINS